MKKLLFILATVFVSSLVMGQDENYIHNTIPQVETIDTSTLTDDQKIESITYFDGLGRPKQQIGIRVSPNKKDIVTHIEYDEYGRQTKQYLPFEQQNGLLGSYNAVDVISEINAYYQAKYTDDFSGVSVDKVNAYSESVHEASPLQRILEQAAPGKDWGKSFELSINETCSQEDFIDDGTIAPISVPIELTVDSEGLLNCSFDFAGTGSGVKLKLGDIKFISDRLPDTVLGYLYDSFSQTTTTYEVSIKSGFLHIASTTQELVKLVDTSFTHQFNLAQLGISIGGNTIKFDYGTNAANEVKLYSVSLSVANNVYTPTLVTSTFYTAEELQKTITKDENWQENQTHINDHTTEEFTNKQGQVVLKRTYNLGIAHDTYYVYDKYGNLTYVLPPKSDAQTALPNAIKLNELCYQYKYDYRNRLVEKKIPGKDWEYIVYDALDRLVLTQDANLRAQNKWLFTKYDVFGRIVYTGIYTHASLQNQVGMQDALDVYYENTTSNLYELKLASEGNYHYYSNTAFPNTNMEILTVNYYDDYTFAIPTTINIPNAIWTTGDIATNTKSLATGSKIKVLETDKWITSITVYDEKSQPIWVGSYNDYLQTTDIIKNKLDFVGKVTNSVSIHKKLSKKDIVVEDIFTYDHAGRLISQVQGLRDTEYDDATNLILDNTATNNQTSYTASNSITLKPDFIALPGFTAKIEATTTTQANELIVLNSYDKLGQLENKKVGGDALTTVINSTGLQTVDYNYNIRGWLKNINQDANNDNDLFNFSLYYNNPNLGTALYNGNISQTSWNSLSINNTTNSVSSNYTYSYDALNRITGAVDDTSNYNLQNVTYDKNGNIKTLFRKGHLDADADTFGTMDNLNYTYDSGNKLMSVTDNGNDTYGFKDGNTVGDDYIYDANGNMVTDKNKPISSTVYNHLNLPTNIGSPAHPGRITYVYDSNGIKLKKIHIAVTGGITETSYAGNYIYKDDVLEFFNHPEGYVQTGTTGEFDYVYQYKDHLGNIRLSYTDVDNNGIIDPNTEIIEESNYYPFGLKHEGYNAFKNIGIGNSTAQKFGFQEQQLDDELGLNWHSYKYRNYDATIARFFNIDPLTEDYMDWGPYVFSGNRVIDARELEGLEPHSVHKTLDGAATNFAEQYNGISIRSKREMGTLFYSRTDNDGNTTYSYSTPIAGGYGLVEPKDAEPIPDGTTNVGEGHTHGVDDNVEKMLDDAGIPDSHLHGSNIPSAPDEEGTTQDAKANPNHEADYTVTPNGKLYKTSTSTGSDGKTKTESKRVRATTIPSDEGSYSRSNKISPNVTPDVLPIGIDKDILPK